MENQNREYKRKLTDRFEQTVIAFLNSKEGGVIYIGIDDDASVYGVKEPNIVQCQIADRIKNNIRGECLGLYDIVHKKIDGKSIIEVIVSSGTEKPYYLKEKGMVPDGCFIRNGSRIEKMTSSMIEKSFARRTRNSLSVIISPRQDLTFEQLKIFYEEHGKKLNEQFAKNLEFLTPEGKYNLNAFLFADQNSITIKVAKFATENKTQLIENEEYGFCSIIKSCKRVLEKLEIENKTFAKVEYPFRKERRMIDVDALREVIVNAFVHNDYSDLMSPAFYIYSNHLEVVSYGGLIDGMSKDELIGGYSRPRNREIMRIFKDVNLVEQLGTGINKIMSVYSPEIFHISPNFLKVEFKFDYLPKEENGELNYRNGELNYRNGELNHRNGELKLSEGAELVFVEIRNNPFIKKIEIAENIGYSNRQVDRCIQELRLKHVIVREGSKKTGCWKINKEIFGKR